MSHDSLAMTRRSFNTESSTKTSHSVSKSFSKYKSLLILVCCHTVLYGSLAVSVLLCQYKEYIIISGYATWFAGGGAIRIAHYDVIDDVITRKL